MSTYGVKVVKVQEFNLLCYLLFRSERLFHDFHELGSSWLFTSFIYPGRSWRCCLLVSQLFFYCFFPWLVWSTPSPPPLPPLWLPTTSRSVFCFIHALLLSACQCHTGRFNLSLYCKGGKLNDCMIDSLSHLLWCHVSVLT